MKKLFFRSLFVLFVLLLAVSALSAQTFATSSSMEYIEVGKNTAKAG